MQKITAAILGAAFLVAAPAMAQTSGSGQSGGSNGANAAHPANVQQLEQKIRQDLQGDGYTNVRVAPDSFLVNATDKRGNPVVMIINPNSVFEITKVGASTANANGSPGPGNNTGASHTK